MKKIIKKENKVLLKVMVEKSQKKFIEKKSKKGGFSEAKFIRDILSEVIIGYNTN